VLIKCLYEMHGATIKIKKNHYNSPSTPSSPKWSFSRGFTSWHVLPTCQPCHMYCSALYQYTKACELQGIEVQTLISSALVSVKGKHLLLSIS